MRVRRPHLNQSEKFFQSTSLNTALAAFILTFVDDFRC